MFIWGNFWPGQFLDLDKAIRFWSDSIESQNRGIQFDGIPTQRDIICAEPWGRGIWFDASLAVLWSSGIRLRVSVGWCSFRLTFLTTWDGQSLNNLCDVTWRNFTVGIRKTGPEYWTILMQFTIWVRAAVSHEMEQIFHYDLKPLWFGIGLMQGWVLDSGLVWFQMVWIDYHYILWRCTILVTRHFVVK